MATEISHIQEKYNIKRPTYEDDELQKLKDLIEPYFLRNESKRQNEACLIRFLRAHLNAVDAYHALLHYTEWREKHSVDAVSDDDHDIIREHNVGRVDILDNYDTCGRPVVLVEVQLHDKHTRDMRSLTKYMVYLLERATAKCKEDIIDNFCLIYDMQGFSMKNMDYSFLRRLISILQSYYPERLGVCLVVNAPWIFYGCWALIRPCIKEKLKQENISLKKHCTTRPQESVLFHFEQQDGLNEVTASKVVFIKDETDLSDFVDPASLPRKLF